MRWMVMVALLSSSACLRQEEAPEAIDASVVSGAEDAGLAFDPCAWDGRTGYCYGINGYVFSGGGCVSVCAPKPGTNGKVFQTVEECAATCMCQPEKLSGSLGFGDHCDRVIAFLEVDAGRDWAEGCAGRQCVLPVSGTIDLTERGTICGYSASSLVRQVACIGQD